jgi:hypothetical protein
VLCKAAWLKDPANEKFKGMASKAQEKAFRESGHWKNADKKVRFSFSVVASRLIIRNSPALETTL